MARTKKAASTEPVVIRGSHSTRTEYPDGRVEFVTHWDELERDVKAALASVGTAVTETPKKTRTRKSKS